MTIYEVVYGLLWAPMVGVTMHENDCMMYPTQDKDCVELCFSLLHHSPTPTHMWSQSNGNEES